MGTTSQSSSVSEQIFQFVEEIARDKSLQRAVEANHDESQWWPTAVLDWRLRMLVAGWSTRISYNMVESYRRVVLEANQLGYDHVVNLPQRELSALVKPLGLNAARVRYCRSLATFLSHRENTSGLDYLTPGELISMLVSEVDGASYKVAQCAVLYSRGYHCGVIPVDSGMVTKLAPCMGIDLPSGPRSHEEFRLLLEATVNHRLDGYRGLIRDLGYKVTLPPGAAPTWWMHLVLIYFKRLYCNRPNSRLCTRRPTCSRVLDCQC